MGINWDEAQRKFPSSVLTLFYAIHRGPILPKATYLGVRRLGKLILPAGIFFISGDIYRMQACGYSYCYNELQYI